MVACCRKVMNLPEEVFDIIYNDATKSSSFWIIEMTLNGKKKQIDEMDIWNSIYYLLCEKKIRPVESNAEPFNKWTIFKLNDTGSS